MKICCLTHADFETPGVIADWARLRRHSFEVFRPYKGDVLPDSTQSAGDLLIVMGGPQSASDFVAAPYLVSEIALIRNMIANQKPVLGFCLGAQLIGEALGAKTERSPEKEVGVYPIELTKSGNEDFLLKELPTTFQVIHWHNDMPGLTADAVVLAESVGCPRQIIRYQKNVYGFQCHLEITLEGIRTMIKACPDDLKPSRFTQTREQLEMNDYASINKTMFAILDCMSALI